MKRITVLAATAAMLLSLISVARAGELKVLSAGIMHFALKDVSDNFTRGTGTKLAITFGGAERVKTRVEKDEPVDVVILPKPDIAGLVTAGKIVPDSVHDIARTALSIAVRKGQPKPDISSLAAVKEALLAAGTIAYYDAAAGGADGILAEHDLAQLGIAHEVAPKAKLWESVQEVIAEKSVDLLVGYRKLRHLVVRRGDAACDRPPQSNQRVQPPQAAELRCPRIRTFSLQADGVTTTAVSLGQTHALMDASLAFNRD